LSDNFLYEGMILFGKSDAAKYGQAGQDVVWLEQAPNSYYWTTYMTKVEFEGLNSTSMANITS